ncbi:MAG: HEAT repeat domain-containing protein, partial [Planctomycetota bacterium]
MLRRIARGSVFAAAAFGAVLGTGLLNEQVTVIEAQDGGSLGSVKEGLREYKKGNWEKAIEKFDAALAQNPTDEDAKKIRDEIGSELALDFINNNLADPGLAGRYSRFGKWVNSGRQKSVYKGRNNNPEEIASFVDAYMGDADIARNIIRAGSIRDVYGDFAIPYIQANYMHSDNADYRYRSRVLLEYIGAQGVHAVIQCFYSTELYDRQTAALALGDIADPRALPILVKHFQDSGEDQQVKDACGYAIKEIRGKLPEKDRNVNKAKDLFYLQAEAIYRNNAAGRYFRNRLVGGTYAGNLPVVMFNLDRAYTVWRWVGNEDGGQLQSQEVPLWAYADILAEECAIQAIELGVAGAKGDANKNAWVQDAEALLSCVRFHMQGEARNRYYNGDDGEREFIVEKLGEYGIVPQMHGFGLAASVGSGRLYDALERSLADGYPDVAVDICRALGDLGDTKM